MKYRLNFNLKNARILIILASIITVRNSSCGKVMFSQVCVKHSVHGGRVSASGLGRVPASGSSGAVHPPGRHPHPRADTPETATAADGTYPTGMHSCFTLHPVQVDRF